MCSNRKILLLKRFIKLVGSSVLASRKLGVSANSVSSWSTGKHEMRDVYYDLLRRVYNEEVNKRSR